MLGFGLVNVVCTRSVYIYSSLFWQQQDQAAFIKFLETPKSFMVGGGGGGIKQLQRLLRSRPPESEIEIELERTWEASRVDLEMVWTRV